MKERGLEPDPAYAERLPERDHDAERKASIEDGNSLVPTHDITLKTVELDKWLASEDALYEEMFYNSLPEGFIFVKLKDSGVGIVYEHWAGVLHYQGLGEAVSYCTAIYEPF